MKPSASFEDLVRTYPAHERGARSKHSGLQAFMLARDAGIPVFTEGVTMDAATTDLREISGVFTHEPHLSWYMRTRGLDNLVVLKFASDKARERVEREYGRLHATLVVERESGMQFFVYQRKRGDPFFRLYRPIVTGLDAKEAHIVSIVPVPGSLHKKSGEKWCWRNKSAPGEIEISRLPKSYIVNLPRLVIGSALSITPRHEFDPRAARGWNDWHDLGERNP